MNNVPGLKLYTAFPWSRVVVMSCNVASLILNETN